MNNENINQGTVLCKSCGASNIGNSKFCIRCGASLQSQTIENDSSTVELSINQKVYEQPVQQQPLDNSLNINTVHSSQTINSNMKSLNYLQYILGALLKPFDKFKSEEDKLNDAKNVSILLLILVGALTIIKLIRTMILTVRVTSFWSNEVKWVWENLKEIQYFKVIGQSLLVYAGILIAIAGVYFLANLVIKKDVKFVKLLGAITTAFIPFAVASSILSPLLAMIYVPLGTCITVIGLVYTLVILLELVNELIPIDNKNTRIYFHLVCLSILCIGGGFITYRLILGSLGSLLS